MDHRRPNKRPIDCLNIDDVDKVYKFRVLLPNATSLALTLREPDPEMPLEEFINSVKEEYFRVMRQSESMKPKRRVMWKSRELFLEDANENKIRKRMCFEKFKPHKCHTLRLHDGSGEIPETFENMWDLTPDTDLLKEFPEEYTFETALADLIDNSLQAVWSNGINERRLVSVEIVADKISIFDTGPGMDDSDENSIVKWGKMGASLHRSSREKAIGGKPPYLAPFFGMFGYGGPIASMHLGRHALVSSKTKESKKVYTLRLEREALLSSSGSEQTWRTDGGIRDPLEDEIVKSPQGSFTKVEIFEPKMKILNIFQLQCKLKDIYFPYIQCDEVSNTGKTITPIEFQVNGINLAEIEGGEVATTNLHSCNGPEFVLQLRFSLNQDNSTTRSPGSKAFLEANARLKCVYFPIVEGKENIERILEKLEAEGCGITENYETFSRVSIRRLGRFLPDARWAWLPFMEPRQKKGDKAQLLKRCCLRVKCFIDTDAGFNPTPSKTDLAHHNPYTTVLKNFGYKPLEKEKEINVEIYRAGKQLNLLQLEREYQDWVFHMHDHYDEEIDCGEDQPVLVVSPSNKKVLGISSDVVRVHGGIRKKGLSWRSGQKIKVLKGACAGCHKNNIYATLEYILLEGFQGDAGGEARIICRPLRLPDENGCILAVNDGNASLDIRGSLSLPISVIDSGKCLAIETAEWDCQLEKQRQKAPSTIDVLSAKHCQELGVDGGLPIDAMVYAGHVPSKEIVAVVRPASFILSSASKNLDQKYIIKDDLEMSMEVKFRDDTEDIQGVCHIYSGRMTPSSHKGFHGLYIFPLGSKFPKLFQKAGVYTFSFSLVSDTQRESSIKKCEKTVRVRAKASSEVGRWGLLSDEKNRPYSVRIGLCFPPFRIACYDEYNNRIPFTSVPEVMVKINFNRGVLAHVDKMKAEFSSNKLTLNVKDVMIESSELDMIRPSYEATLVICSLDELFSISIPCQVTPGPLRHVIAKPQKLENQLLPGCVIKEFVLEMFDAYRNHVRKGSEVLLNVDGFRFQDQIGSNRKVNDHGFVDLSGLLKVTGGYGKNVSLSVLSENEVVFKKEFQTEKRELRAASRVPESCPAGSQLDNIVFEVVDSKGDVDESIHHEEKYGQSHTLAIKSVSLDTDDSVRYIFRHGRCIIPAIPIPQKEGNFCLVAAHSRHLELHLSVKILVVQALKVEDEDIQPQCSDGKILLLQDSSALKHVGNLVESIMNDEKELEDDICKIGLRIGNNEKTLKVLNDRKAAIEQDLSELQDSMELDSTSHSVYLSEKEEMMQRIESKDDSAAAVICNLCRDIPFQEPRYFMEDIVGLVALLGTVHTNNLSRILAEYLKEDQMLAIVCKSYATAGTLEKYEQNGKVDHKHGLQGVATALGKFINGRFLVICLEDIRPYTGELGSDPQRKLALPDPTLPTGKIPPGYLGYAVNMINLDIHHLHTSTAAGHGLRETLLYHLFGELQVYETRECMKQAHACIKQGAVSLDGGIMRGNGVISLGYREPDIHFPVVASGSEMHLTPQNMEILKQVEEKKSELRVTLGEIGRVTKANEKDLKKFARKRERYRKFMDEKEPLLKDYFLEYGSNVENSSKNSPF